LSGAKSGVDEVIELFILQKTINFVLKTKIIIFFLIVPYVCFAQEDTLNVLFLGNSYTASNNLPSLFENLSESGNKQVEVGTNAPGGYWLEYHSSDLTSLSMINRGLWDYVVLQEQSQVPTIEYYRYNSMYPSAIVLDSVIHACNDSVSTLFFMTWGRKYGGQQTINGYSSPVFEDFFHMQDSLSAAYNEIAGMLSAMVAPVGNAWATAITMDSTTHLWTLDNSHPTLEGSYLAACVFFTTIFDETPVGLPYTAGLSEEDALFLQSAAEQTVQSASQPISGAPCSFALLPNYPNPFNQSTSINFHLPAQSYVQLSVYDITGRAVAELAKGEFDSGEHSLVFDSRNLPSGIYFARLTAEGKQSMVRKMVLVK